MDHNFVIVLRNVDAMFGIGGQERSFMGPAGPEFQWGTILCAIRVKG